MIRSKDQFIVTLSITMLWALLIATGFLIDNMATKVGAGILLALMASMLAAFWSGLD